MHVRPGKIGLRCSHEHPLSRHVRIPPLPLNLSFFLSLKPSLAQLESPHAPSYTPTYLCEQQQRRPHVESRWRTSSLPPCFPCCSLHCSRRRPSMRRALLLRRRASEDHASSSLSTLSVVVLPPIHSSPPILAIHSSPPILAIHSSPPILAIHSSPPILAIHSSPPILAIHHSSRRRRLS